MSVQTPALSLCSLIYWFCWILASGFQDITANSSSETPVVLSDVNTEPWGLDEHFVSGHPLLSCGACNPAKPPTPKGTLLGRQGQPVVGWLSRKERLSNGALLTLSWEMMGAGKEQQPLPAQVFWALLLPGRSVGRLWKPQTRSALCCLHGTGLQGIGKLRQVKVPEGFS